MPNYLSESMGRQLVPQWTSATTVSSDVILLYLDAVEDLTRTFLGYNPAHQTEAEFFLDGDGSEALWLPYSGPVHDIVSVHEDWTGRAGQNPDGAFASDTELVMGTGFVAQPRADGQAAYSGCLFRVGRNWPETHRRHNTRLASHLSPARGCVKVVAEVGFRAGAPAGVVQASYQCAAAMYLTRTGIGAVLSQSVDGISKSYGTPPGTILDGESAPFQTAALKAALRPWKRTAFS